MLKTLVDGLSDDQLKLFIALGGGICLVLGTLITGVFGVMIARWNRNSLARTEIRKLAIEAGLENWRHQNTLKIDLMKEARQGHLVLDSPDAYIIHMLRIMNIAADMKLSAYDAANRVSQWSHGEIESDGKPIPKNEENEQDEPRNRH